jgi:ureidoglycolate lyase
VARHQLLGDARALALRPLTQEAFAHYGDVITSAGRAGRPINAGTSQRVDLPDLDVIGDGGAPSLSVFRARAVRLPLKVHQLERHRLGSQTFLPLGAAFALVVALGNHAPETDTLVAFHVPPDRGITLRRGVWHHSLIALADGDFAVIERRGLETDCEVADVEPTMLVEASDGTYT